MHAASSVIAQSIKSLYPTRNGLLDPSIPILNCRFEPRGMKTKRLIHILWSSMSLGKGYWVTNHFVPLLLPRPGINEIDISSTTEFPPLSSRSTPVSPISSSLPLSPISTDHSYSCKRDDKKQNKVKHPVCSTPSSATLPPSELVSPTSSDHSYSYKCKDDASSREYTHPVSSTPSSPASSPSPFPNFNDHSYSQTQDLTEDVSESTLPSLNVQKEENLIDDDSELTLPSLSVNQSQKMAGFSIMTQSVLEEPEPVPFKNEDANPDEDSNIKPEMDVTDITDMPLNAPFSNPDKNGLNGRFLSNEDILDISLAEDVSPLEKIPVGLKKKRLFCYDQCERNVRKISTKTQIC